MSNLITTLPISVWHTDWVRITQEPKSVFAKLKFMAKYAVVRYPRCFCFSLEYLIRYVSLIRFQASKITTILCFLVRFLLSQTWDLTALQYVEKEGVSLPVLCSLCQVGGEAHKMSTLAIMRWEIVSLHRPAKKDWRPWRGDFCYLLSLWSFGHFHFHGVLAAAAAFRFGVRSLEGGRWGHQQKVEICFRCCRKSWDISNKYYELSW